MELTFSGETTQPVALLPAEIALLSSFDQAACAIVPPLMRGGSDRCVAAVGIDLAGNRSPADTECFTVQACEPFTGCSDRDFPCVPLADRGGCAVALGSARHGGEGTEFALLGALGLLGALCMLGPRLRRRQ